jgi:hypothetical protein
MESSLRKPWLSSFPWTRHRHSQGCMNTSSPRPEFAVFFGHPKGSSDSSAYLTMGRNHLQEFVPCRMDQDLSRSVAYLSIPGRSVAG